MSTLTIRNVDDATHSRLRERAAQHGRSVEAEVRSILSAAVGAPTQNFLLELRDRVQGLETELELPSRTDAPRPVDLP